MNIIVPMAGMGKRMRPHTLTVPKPLIPIAGKPIVQRLIEDISNISNETIEEIAFIVGDFGKEVEKRLEEIANSVGASSKIYYQHTALGTAHAVLCAENSLKGKVIVAFADTLFNTDIKLSEENPIIWVKKVDNPKAFGVVKVDGNNIITDFIEKPQEFVSDLAIIGVYYFNDGENLKKELQYLIDTNFVVKGEYQLTDALENMKAKGVKFKTGIVNEWLDCGNKDATVYTNQRILEIHKNEKHISDSATTLNTIIIPPCYIGNNVKIENSIIGPHVSIENDTAIKNSLIKNSMIQSNSVIEDLNIENSMVGNFVDIKGKKTEVNIGDYSTFAK